MLKEITLPISGAKVKVKKVSPLLAVELRKQFPAPRPPRNKVTDLDGRVKWEENPADPEYLDALRKYEEETEQRISRLLFKRGVQVTVDEEAVKEIKEFWKNEFEKELEESDLEIYIRYVLIQGPEDMELLTGEILGMSQPTEEAVNAAQQSFRG